MQLEFRKSTTEDIVAMAQIASDGKAFLKRCGVSQWQKGPYPSADDFAQDVVRGIGHVMTEAEQVLAVCAVTFDDEPAYRGLFGGSWLTPPGTRYATIHRCAVAAGCRGRGVIGHLFDAVSELAAKEGALSIRIDTHPDNLAMQSALRKAGFTRCGELILVSGYEEGDLRLGYERKLPPLNL